MSCGRSANSRRGAHVAAALADAEERGMLGVRGDSA